MKNMIIDGEQSLTDLANNSLPQSIQNLFRHSSIGKSILVKGNLKDSEGDIIINGRIDGLLEFKYNLVEVGIDGQIMGDVHGRKIIVAGEITGNLFASEQIIIKETGHVLGDVHTPDIIIEGGAVLKGKMFNEDIRNEGVEDILPSNDDINKISFENIFKKIQQFSHLPTHSSNGYETVWVMSRNCSVPQKIKEGILYIQKTGDGVIKVYHAAKEEPKILNQRACDELNKLDINFIAKKMYKIDEEEIAAKVIAICGFTHLVPQAQNFLFETNLNDNGISINDFTENDEANFSRSFDQSVIGQTLLIEGDVSADENMVCNGKIKGTIYFQNNKLELTSKAKLIANIFVKELLAYGEIEGDVCSNDHVTLKKPAHLYGNILAPRIIIESGAVATGSVEMDPKKIEKVFSSIEVDESKLSLKKMKKNPSEKENVKTQYSITNN